MTAALDEQLRRRQKLLLGGARRVGWKLGVGERERIGGQIAVGHLTSATRLEPGTAYVAGESADLHADAEIAIELGRDVEPGAGSDDVLGAIAGWGAALELVDLAPLANEPESVVAANVFHRAVAFGPMHPARAPGEVEATLTVNGERRRSGRGGDELVERLHAAARSLAAVGERLRAGDLVITGSVVQVPVRPGDEVVADLGALGAVGLSIVRRPAARAPS